MPLFLIGLLYLHFSFDLLNFIFVVIPYIFSDRERNAFLNLLCIISQLSGFTSYTDTVKRLLYFWILVFHSGLPLNYSVAQT